MRGGSAGRSVRGPESQDEAREYLKDPIDLAIDVLFEVFHIIFFGGGVFSTQILNFEISLSVSPGPKSSLVPPCKISLGRPDCK